MQHDIRSKLHSHLAANYPEVLVELQSDQKVTLFLEQKLELLDDLPELLLAKGSPEYIVVDMCLEVLTKAMGPSCFNYFCSLLQNEFEVHYYSWLSAGVLPYEVINLMERSREIFQEHNPADSDWEEEPFRCSVINVIANYLTEE